MNASQWLWFTVACGAGGAARYAVSLALPASSVGAIGWSTLSVNVVGAFALGLLTGLASRGTLPSEDLVVLGTGFCGSFTTFAAITVMSVESVLARRGGVAVANVVANLALGLVAAAAGLALSS